MMQTTIEYRNFVEGSIFWSRAFQCKNSDCLWPLRARWIWLDSECNLREKVVEWKFPFDFEEHVEKFFDASLSADFSNLPNPILSNRERDKTSWFDVNGFLCKCLGLDIGELEKVKSLKLEDLPNDWEFVVKLDGWGGKNMKWLVHGLEHDKKIRRD